MHRALMLLTVLMLLMPVGCKSDKPGMNEATKQKVTIAAVPPKTAQAFAKDHPDVRLDWVQKLIKNNGDVHYEFKFTEKDGRKGEAEYDSVGEKASFAPTLK
jgi:uncharacterized membrane protein YkoI